MKSLLKIAPWGVPLLLSGFLIVACHASGTKEAPKKALPPPATAENAVKAKEGKLEAPILKFDFGSGEVEAGYRPVLASTRYSKARGYGIINKQPVKAVDRAGSDALRSDFVTSNAPFYFSVDLPEGNYEVTVTLGDQEGESVTTIKAESRRLMLEKVQTSHGKMETHTFLVNVRTPKINAQESIRLKPREENYLNWDGQLTLEFNNSRPCIAAIEITSVNDVITVFLAGNSTMVDQEYEPWAAWGQMLPRFFKPGVVIANYAESGESLKRFVWENRLKKILSLIQKGDYLFIAFAHNDQKSGAAHVKPYTTYQEQLQRFITAARERGAIPVLVTSMHRRRFDENGKVINTLGDYPEAMRQTAKARRVPCIDLNAMSKVFYEAMGPEESKKAFVHYPAGTFPGQDKALKDNTHFNSYGAYELARCMVEGIKKNKLPLAAYLKEDLEPFDPARPDPVEAWQLPRSPDVTMIRPEGD